MIDSILKSLDIDFAPAPVYMTYSESHLSQKELFSKLDEYICVRGGYRGYSLGSFGNNNNGPYGFFKYAGYWFVTISESGSMDHITNKRHLCGVFRTFDFAADFFLGFIVDDHVDFFRLINN
jgi:hypothetical protein